MIEFSSNCELLEEARRLQSEAISRYVGVAWRWLRSAIRSAATVNGVIAR